MSTPQKHAALPLSDESITRTFDCETPFRLSLGDGRLEFCYGARPASNEGAGHVLRMPEVDSVEQAMLDPASARAIVRIAPYPEMACGDKVVLRWEGLDVEGYAYEHEMVRFVSEGQVGKELVFVVKSLHIAALDGGSLKVYWTLVSAAYCVSLPSAVLHLNVGDPATHLLAPHVEESVGEILDPGRITYGVSILLQPYARMAPGDRIQLSWETGATSYSDSLVVEEFSAGEPLSFWVAPDHLKVMSGDKVNVRYEVQKVDGLVQVSATTRLVCAEMNRGILTAPVVLEAQDGVLQVQDSMDGVSIVIGDAQAEDGELVYLKCDSDFLNHRDSREITRETAGQPLLFVVPYRFWREHVGSSVRVAYSVERDDEVSQASAVTHVRVEG